MSNRCSLDFHDTLSNKIRFLYGDWHLKKRFYELPEEIKKRFPHKFQEPHINWAGINEDHLYANAIATDTTGYGMDWYWLEGHW